VVEEDSATPISSLIAATYVAETIVNAAIETDTRPPVTFVKNKDAITPGPITRSPQQTRCGHQHPRTRDPEVAVEIIVSPVSGYPKVAVTGAKRLLIHR